MSQTTVNETIAVMAADITKLQEELSATNDLVLDLTERLVKLEEAAKPNNKSQREMTDADARRILDGDLKDMKHNEAVKATGLSYGQIYSCRGEYTFRHIHKVLKEAGWKNPWKK